MAVVEPGDHLRTEPGNMTGPTRQGVNALLSTDPNAYWDAASKSVKGSAYSDPLLSPRVALIPFYDPLYPPRSGRSYVIVHSLGAVFIEGINNSGDVTGRFMKTVPYSPASSGRTSGMLAVARLIQDSSRGAAQ